MGSRVVHVGITTPDRWCAAVPVNCISEAQRLVSGAIAGDRMVSIHFPTELFITGGWTVINDAMRAIFETSWMKTLILQLTRLQFG